MNIQNYGVAKMSTREKREINGGWINLVIGLVIAAAVEVISDWGNFKAGLAGKMPIEK